MKMLFARKIFFCLSFFFDKISDNTAEILTSSEKSNQQKSNSDDYEDITAFNWDQCSVLEVAKADINTKDEFSNFDFEVDEIKKPFWDESFETRYTELMKNTHRPPLKVIITPHSHNDPGWLKTFVEYFQDDTREILNLAATKMIEFSNMTFIWSEICFLEMWWEQAEPSQQQALKKLIEEGRLEITTGGWVMTDEANSHFFAMLDQLIEGHQWLKTNLNYTPKSGWSIDPFGHGSTVPYLLAASGFEGTIIQRIHYGWKKVSELFKRL